jgi:type II secretory pathway pseudopilin PulG
MKRCRSDQGFALVAGILVLSVISGLALALLLLTNSGQKAALREQASESAFNTAEAALSQQISQLSRLWPVKEGEVPSRCAEATTTATNGCPTGSLLSASYPTSTSTSCQGKAPVDSWGSPVTNEWTTYVRDDVEGASAPFNSAVEKTAQPFDANGDGKVWLRSVGLVQCRMVVVVELVSREAIAVPFPRNVVVANWFETRNNGKKVIVNTKGESSQTTNISLRCTPPPEGKPCAKYEKEKGQVSPGEVVEEPGTSPALSASKLETLRQQAEAAGTYYAAGKCPAGLPSGKLVYVEGPCNISGGGNEVANSEAAPGFLVIVNGTLSMGGTSTFYGDVYCVNKQSSNGALVETQGHAKIVGEVVVDGAGGSSFNASGENVVYSAKAAEELVTYAGVAPTRNSYRILSNGE